MSRCQCYYCCCCCLHSAVNNAWHGQLWHRQTDRRVSGAFSRQVAAHIAQQRERYDRGRALGSHCHSVTYLLDSRDGLGENNNDGERRKMPGLKYTPANTAHYCTPSSIDVINVFLRFFIQVTFFMFFNVFFNFFSTFFIFKKSCQSKVWICKNPARNSITGCLSNDFYWFWFVT